MAISYTLWTFVIFCGNWVNFGMLHREKSGNPGRTMKGCKKWRGGFTSLKRPNLGLIADFFIIRLAKHFKTSFEMAGVAYILIYNSLCRFDFEGKRMH
jgi:hypothetical protein